jgi:hypothetical protein
MVNGKREMVNDSAKVAHVPMDGLVKSIEASIEYRGDRAIDPDYAIGVGWDDK